MQRVLLIEDDENTLLGLEKLLEYEGFEVIGTSSGNQGLELLNQEEVQVVLCDYCLPDLNGLEVCQAVRERGKPTRFLLVTAYSNQELIQKAEEIGVEKVFSKPIDLDDLLKTLNNTPKATDIPTQVESVTN